MPRAASQSTRERILAATLKLMESAEGADAVTVRGVATSVGMTAMAIDKHFQNREALPRAVTAAEYPRIASDFERANASKNVPGLRGMLGYLDYALDHPQLFRYMFSSHRADAFSFPQDVKGNKSPTFNILQTVVSQLMDQRVIGIDDVGETALSIWAHAHGLIMLHRSGRITLPRRAFRWLYMRSLDRLVHGLKNGLGTER